jgi:hypothetical protein
MLSQWPSLRVGDHEVTIEQAEAWLQEYIKDDRSRERPYAFPAYDRYQPGSDPDRLSDGDLLAPVLLNVGVSIRAFYDLQALTGRLDAVLVAIDRDLTLEAASESQVEHLVTELYAVIDERPGKPRDVGVTKLSKVLHRKRPHFLILHDQQVQACYRQRVCYPKPERSWARYMVDVSLAVRQDLRSQVPAFDRLSAVSGATGTLSRVRLLDILAWNLGRKG